MPNRSVDNQAMGNVAALNVCALSKYAFAPLPDGRPAFARSLAFAASLPGVERVYLLGASRLPVGEASGETAGPDGRRVPIVRIDREEWSLRDLVAALVEITPEGDLFYLFGDCPLYDLALSERMYESHRRYYAEYTFVDAYPFGLAPMVLKGSLIRHLPRLLTEADGAVERDSLFTLLQRDINAFDVETIISPIDLRLLRVQLTCDSRRNYLLVRRVLESGVQGETAILELLRDKGGLLRTLPAFVEIQITDGITQTVSYSPYPLIVSDAVSRRSEMSLDSFRRVVEQLSGFCEDATVSLSLWGEPGLHSQLPALLGELCSHEGLAPLIESSGVGWRDGLLEEIARAVGNRITWVVDLDAAAPELYRELRGDGWEEAQGFCERLLALFPGKVYVQAVRLTESEQELESFYLAWKDRVPNVIIQKYDSYAGFLRQRKVTDLSPLARLPCWHLKRDLVVLLDGTVPMCREDLASLAASLVTRGPSRSPADRRGGPSAGQQGGAAERSSPLPGRILGNLFEEELSVIWERGQELHARHVAGDYPEICRACDEYYTFNF